MDILAAMRRCGRDGWTHGLFYAGWTALGTLPLWGLLFILVLLSRPLSLEAVAGKGELALYSAAIVAGALRVVNKEVKLSSLLAGDSDGPQWSLVNRLQVRFPSYGLVVFVSSAIMAASAIVFALTIATDVEMRAFVVSRITLVLLVLSLGLGVVVVAVDKTEMSEMDLKRRLDQPKLKLEEEFDRLSDGG